MSVLGGPNFKDAFINHFARAIQQVDPRCQGMLWDDIGSWWQAEYTRYGRAAFESMSTFDPSKYEGVHHISQTILGEPIQEA